MLLRVAKKVPVSMPGERSKQQKQQVRDAQMHRAMLHRGAMLERMQEKLSQGNEGKGKGKGKGRPLNPKQLPHLARVPKRSAAKASQQAHYDLRPWPLETGKQLLRGHRWKHWRLRQNCPRRLGATRPHRFRTRLGPRRRPAPFLSSPFLSLPLGDAPQLAVAVSCI